jgi:hypothetical protein
MVGAIAFNRPLDEPMGASAPTATRPAAASAQTDFDQTVERLVPKTLPARADGGIGPYRNASGRGFPPGRISIERWSGLSPRRFLPGPMGASARPQRNASGRGFPPGRIFIERWSGLSPRRFLPRPMGASAPAELAGPTPAVYGRGCCGRTGRVAGRRPLAGRARKPHGAGISGPAVRPGLRICRVTT